jgi:hypothetical protein
LAPALGCGQDPLHLPRPHHASLVHHQHVAPRQLVPALLPAPLQARQRPALDAAAALQSLGRDAGQRRPAHPVARCLPRLLRQTQHRRLARAGVAHHQRQIPPSRDVMHRVPLLRSKLQAAGLSLPHRTVHLHPAHPVRHRRAQLRRGALHALLGCHHVPRAEPLPPAPVLPEPHQLGRGLHLRHHLGKLLRPVRVPRHEPRHVLPRERRMLPRQRVQCDIRIFQDALAVAPRDVVMLGPPLRILAPLRPSRPGRPYLVLRLQLDVPLGIGAVIDARIMTQLMQPLVRHLGPALAPTHQQWCRIPAPLLRPEPSFILVPSRSLLCHDLPHGQHDVRVRLRFTVRANTPMHVQVGHHAARHELLPHEILRQRDGLRSR